MWSALGVAVLSAVLLVVYGEPHLGYDSWFALAWGQEIASGRLPTIEARIAPTPHPLANVVSALLTVFGDGAPAVLAFISVGAFAAAGVAAFHIGRHLSGRLAGTLFAAVLLTRPSLVAEMLYCSIDIPFMALLLWGGVAVLRGAPRHALVLVFLAGTARPEAWALGAVYVVLLVRRRELGYRAGVVAAAAAPAIWIACDLITTGNPLHSLQGTRELADQLGRPQSLATALRVIPEYLQSFLGDAIAMLGLATAFVSLWVARARMALPLIVLGVGLAGFLALGLAGLPLLFRYTLVPGLAVMALASVALAAPWRHRAALPRPAVIAGCVVSACLVVLSATADVAADRRQVAAAAEQLRMEEALTELVRATSVRDGLTRCGRAQVPHYRPVPQVLYLLKLSPGDVVVAGGPLARGVGLDPLPGAAAAAYRLTEIDRATFTASQIEGTTLVAANARWAARLRCEPGG